MAERSDSENLLRIKTDTKELSRQQSEAQQKIDAIKVQIDKEGPTATLEARMDEEVATQKSICIRSDIALSIIGASIKDLARDSQDPPSVVAVRKLLNSLEYLDNEVSLESVKMVLAVQTQYSADSLTDVFEDLESTFKSTSKGSNPKTTEIVQETQLPIRELATEPWARWNARYNARQRTQDLERQRKQQRTFASTIDLPFPQRNHGTDLPPQITSRSTQSNQVSRKNDQSSKAQDLHRYLDDLLGRAPGNDVRETHQKLDPMYRPKFEQLRTRKLGERHDQALGSLAHKALGSPKHLQAENVVAEL